MPIRITHKLLLRGRPKRSIWTGTPIFTLTLSARSESMLGVNAKSLVTSTYSIARSFDYDLSSCRSWPIIGRLVPFVIFLWVCAFVDRVHAFCDRAILPQIERSSFNSFELLIYRLLRIELFVYAYGGDVRSRETTRQLGEPNCCTECTLVGIACVCDEELRRRNLVRLGTCARAIFAMGDMIEYTAGSRNDLFYWPVDLAADGGRRYAPAYPAPEARNRVRIVHAPNHRMFKGTRFLETAVSDLAREGVPVELVLVEGISNEQALMVYCTADIIFDQCLIGFHGYFALESMALGKPVMCYIRKREYLLAPEECPIINVHPKTLRDDIRRVVANRGELGELGRRGRRYVEKYYSLEALAGRLARAYADLEVSP